MADGVRRWRVRYRAHNGFPRPAIVLVPPRYGPQRPTPPLPFVVLRHRRGVRAQANARLWGDLPERGEIADLAQMPSIVHATLPWLRVDRERVFALGGSMGGHETLLLVAPACGCGQPPHDLFNARPACHEAHAATEVRVNAIQRRLPRLA